MTGATGVEFVEYEGTTLGLVVGAAHTVDRTKFLTPPEFKQQLGFVVYPAGGAVAPHVHLPLTRNLVGTSEVLVVRSGRMVVDFYSDRHELVASREVLPGDVVMFVSGGHGIRFLEDSILLEVKQGPFTGLDEKERFEP